MQARGKLDDIFKVLEKKLSAKNIIPNKLTFNNKGEIKTFKDSSTIIKGVT